MTKPTYTAEGNAIFHKPVEKTQSDGRKSVSMGFQVVTVCDWLNDGAPQEIADLLNKGEKFDALLNTLRRIASAPQDHHSFAPLVVSEARAAIEAVADLAAA